MKSRDIERYNNDLKVMHIKIDFHAANWWKQKRILGTKANDE